MVVVLIAEDEPAIRSLASMILKSAGYSVVSAGNGLEAISLYRSAPERYDLVLTDLDMPVMNGYQLIKLIQESRPKAKIIMMSGNPERDLPPGLPLLRKPFLPDALREAVSRTLAAEPVT